MPSITCAIKYLVLPGILSWKTQRFCWEQQVCLRKPRLQTTHDYRGHFVFFFVIYKKKETLFYISDTIFFYVCHAKNKKPWPSATDVIKLLISTFFSFTTFTEIKWKQFALRLLREFHDTLERRRNKKTLPTLIRRTSKFSPFDVWVQEI